MISIANDFAGEQVGGQEGADPARVGLRIWIKDFDGVFIFILLPVEARFQKGRNQF